MAHEIGHTLLGPDAHAATGIMRNRLQLVDMKALLCFTLDEGKHLRSDLSARDETPSDRVALP